MSEKQVVYGERTGAKLEVEISVTPGVTPLTQKLRDKSEKPRKSRRGDKPRRTA